MHLKACFVARGFSQVYGIDYIDTYAPVAKLTLIKILFAIAASLDLKIHQMDVVTAFLANILHEEIYIKQPEGFVDDGHDVDMVCELGKSLYRLKRLAHLWNQKLDRYLHKISYTQTNVDPCVYVNNDNGVIVAMWVDDLIIFGKDSVGVDFLKLQLRMKFEMKDMGELQYFLRIQVLHDRKKKLFQILQHEYVNMILERFDMHNSSPVFTPMATGTKLTKTMEDSEKADIKQYQSNVRSQMYAMLCTMPDLTYAISQISQFSSNPSTIHESAAKGVLRYLNGTRNFGITFNGNRGLILEGYKDADWGAGEDRKSISGYVFTLVGSAVSWSSKRQSTTALSTMEAEYIALVQVAKESIRIQGLLQELGFTAINSKIVYRDNQGSIALTNNPEYHARTKHINILYHFIRECIQNNKIDLKYCPTADMITDGMTKALPKEKHLDLLAKIGIGEIADRVERTNSPSPIDRQSTELSKKVNMETVTGSKA